MRDATPTRDRRPSSTLRYVLAYPAFVASWVFFVCCRTVLQTLSRWTADEEQATSWQRLDDLLDQPLALPYVMVSGPRWNTHALIATLGPLDVDDRLTVDVSGLDDVGWYLVLYAQPGNATVAWHDHTRVDPGVDTVAFDVDPGTYAVVARAYDADGTVRLPPVRVDGEPTIPARTMDDARPPYSADWFDYRSAFYDALHYYVFFGMRHRDRTSASFLRDEYLPVGNPGTAFAYGAVDAGTRLHVELSETLAATHAAYVTVYNRSSFPQHSAPVGGPGRGTHHTTPALDDDGTYLVRVVPATDGAPDPPALDDHVTVTGLDAAPRVAATSDAP